MRLLKITNRGKAHPRELVYNDMGKITYEKGDGYKKEIFYDDIGRIQKEHIEISDENWDIYKHIKEYVYTDYSMRTIERRVAKKKCDLYSEWENSDELIEIVVYNYKQPVLKNGIYEKQDLIFDSHGRKVKEVFILDHTYKYEVEYVYNNTSCKIFERKIAKSGPDCDYENYDWQEIDEIAKVTEIRYDQPEKVTTSNFLRNSFLLQEYEYDDGRLILEKGQLYTGKIKKYFYENNLKIKEQYLDIDGNANEILLEEIRYIYDHASNMISKKLFVNRNNCLYLVETVEKKYEKNNLIYSCAKSQFYNEPDIALRDEAVENEFGFLEVHFFSPDQIWEVYFSYDEFGNIVTKEIKTDTGYHEEYYFHNEYEASFIQFIVTFKINWESKQMEWESTKRYFYI